MSKIPALFVNDNTPSHRTMRGTSRYVRHIVDGIIAAFGAEATIFSAEQRDYSPARFVPAPTFRGVRRLGIHDQVASLLCRRFAPKVVYTTFFGKARTSAKEVFTVYDMTMETTSLEKQAGYVVRDLAEKRSCLERATALIAISANTAKEIVHIYPQVDPGKIYVTPLGVSEFFFQQPPEPTPTFSDRPYFIFVGYRDGHKNFINLLHAFGQIGMAKHADLAVIAPHAFDKTEQHWINHYGLGTAIKLIERVDEGELRAYYQQAIAHVYPSTLEGFGLPILEAMASGTLVATSNTSCMPEVGGTAAFYFDPFSPESIGQTLQTLIELPLALRTQRIAYGLAWAHTFTWERCQRQTVDVLQKVMD